MPKSLLPKIPTEKAQEALIVYFYTGSLRKAGAAIGTDHHTIKKIYDLATPEQLEAAKKKSNAILEERLCEIFDLAFGRLIEALKSPEPIPASTLNIIAGTQTDKIIALRQLVKGKEYVVPDLNISVALGTSNLISQPPAKPVDEADSRIREALRRKDGK